MHTLSLSCIARVKNRHAQPIIHILTISSHRQLILNSLSDHSRWGWTWWMKSCIVSRSFWLQLSTPTQTTHECSVEVNKNLSLLRLPIRNNLVTVVILDSSSAPRLSYIKTTSNTIQNLLNFYIACPVTVVLTNTLSSDKHWNRGSIVY